MDSIVGINKDTASYTLGVPFLVYIFFQVTLLILMIAALIKTWRDVHDHIFVRGELILQASLLSIVVVTQFGIFLVDATSTKNEEYDELFYFCYFVLATVQCFCSVLVSTKYLVFRQWRSAPSFAKVIGMEEGLEAFQDYLVTKNEQNSIAVRFCSRGSVELPNDSPDISRAICVSFRFSDSWQRY